MSLNYLKILEVNDECKSNWSMLIHMRLYINLIQKLKHRCHPSNPLNTFLVKFSNLYLVYEYFSNKYMEERKRHINSYLAFYPIWHDHHMKYSQPRSNYYCIDINCIDTYCKQLVTNQALTDYLIQSTCCHIF